MSNSIEYFYPIAFRKHPRSTRFPPPDFLHILQNTLAGAKTRSHGGAKSHLRLLLG